MVVNRYGKRSLGAFLTDHVAVEQLIEVLGRRQRLFDGLGRLSRAFRVTIEVRRHCADALVAKQFAVEALKKRLAIGFGAPAEGAVAC